MSDMRETNPEFDKKLDKLIGRASRILPDQFIRPSQKVIQAYLLGTASEAETQEIHKAFEQSAAFRREMLEMADDLEEISSPEAEEKCRDVAIDKIPDFSPYIEKTPEIVPIWGRLKNIFALPRLIPAVAVAALLVLVSVQIFRDRDMEMIRLASWDGASETLDPGELIALDFRQGVVKDEGRSYDTPRIAALAGFRQILVFEEGNFMPREDIKPPSLPDPAATYKLRLMSDSGELLQEYMAMLPIEDEQAPLEVQAWLLLLPSRQLRSIGIEDETTSVIRPDEEDNLGYIIFSYRTKDGYRSILAVKR